MKAMEMEDSKSCQVTLEEMKIQFSTCLSILRILNLFTKHNSAVSTFVTNLGLQ